MGRKEGDLFARVPLEWIPELDARAQAEGLSRSDIIRRAIRNLLQAPEPPQPALTVQEQVLLEAWRQLRTDDPEVAEAWLRLGRAAQGRLQDQPEGRRTGGQFAGDANHAGR